MFPKMSMKRFVPTTLRDLEVYGRRVVYDVSESAAFGKVGYFDPINEVFEISDNTDDSTLPATIMFISNSGEIIQSGWIRNDSWTFNPGKLWVGTNGNLVDVKPSNGAFAQLAGFAIMSHLVYYDPSFYIEYTEGA